MSIFGQDLNFEQDVIFWPKIEILANISMLTINEFASQRIFNATFEI